MNPATFADASDLRLLDAWEAGRRASPVDRADHLLWAAGLEPADDETLGTRDGRLLAVRRTAFGSHVEALVACPACDVQLQSAFDLDDVISDSAPIEGPLEARSADGAHHASFRLPTVADLRAAAAAHDPVASYRILIRRCVTDARRDMVPVEVESLPSDLLEGIAEAMAAGDRQADVRLTLTCPDCGHRWEARFDIASFLWMEVDAHVRRLLVDVHALARAYGWSEADILGLPPARRRAYLELVLG